MPSKTQHKIQFARGRGALVVKDGDSWWVLDEWSLKEEYDVPNVWGPYLSKRQAKNVAYSLAVGQNV